jgi:uncharacterized protein YndB with AHSA1/START domain
MSRGEYVEVDGRPAVRFNRTFDLPAERVWRAVSAPAELSAWFPAQVAHDGRAGGEIVFTGDPNLPRSTGELLVVEPPHRLVFTWGDDELHLEVEALGADRTRLTLTNVLSVRDTAARNASGWTVCLRSLDDHLAGTATDPHAAPPEAFRELYAAHVADGLPHGAAIPGFPDLA